MQSSAYSVVKGVKAGAIGGLVGAVVLGLFAGLGSMAMGQEVFYVTIGEKLGLGDASVIGGWALHFVVGLVAGAVFVGVTALLRIFALTSMRRGVWVGTLGGVAVWLVVYVPVTGTLVPSDLTDPTFAVGSFILHLVYGVVTAIVAVQVLQRGLRISSQSTEAVVKPSQ